MQSLLCFDLLKFWNKHGLFRFDYQKFAFISISLTLLYTANEGPVRVQYKCLIPIYVFLYMKLLFPKQNYNVQSPSSCSHISVRDLYISKICLAILLQEICGPILGIYKSLTDT
jgi:hypothetical protein